MNSGTQEPNSLKIVGYEVVVECSKGMVYVPGHKANWLDRIHKRGTEQAARRRAMFIPFAQAVVEVIPYTSPEWDAAFGLNQRM